jgi:hypothetical protein
MVQKNVTALGFGSSALFNKTSPPIIENLVRLKAGERPTFIRDCVLIQTSFG